MIKQTTQQIADILNAKLVGDGNVTVENVSTDTRQAVSFGLFFALKGEKFDAHDYAQKAVEQGCVALVVERPLAIDVPQIIVADTRLALGELAKWLKAKLNPKTVAMTGSSGKTTVKEMTAKILQQVTACEDEVLYTFGNLNNDLGVPLTLLRLTDQHKFAVVELGANHLGEIAYTTAITQPDACLVNNVASAHLEGFGSLAGVAQAKGEIYRGLKKDGIAIVNLAHYFPEWQKEIGKHELQSFSYTGQDKDSYADFWAEDVVLNLTGSQFILHSPQGEVEINLPYLGKHNVSNALAAASLAMAVGADLNSIKAGLEQRSQVKGRLFPIEINPNLLLIDDSYNANVDSMKSAVAVLQQYPAFRIFAVGDMAELGVESLACHQEVADFVAQAGLDLVVSFGQESAVISQNSAHHFSNKAQMVDFLYPLILQKIADNQPLVLLVKGSRSQKMEELLDALILKFNVS
ncbi:UDP-N-acetylmuramoyl-tripeptide--D-alanyl-D-alanine ligase [Vespertiliibacter pulmonis]|uniref:UDP-N-acetylmuramoyl-tripeptide--D-alanyl-D-alanine ligase n=1 Tax=Vespertiliibacter pulmonis TaxID=1443036 RepID=A0A3N4VZ15_9PAST|nr:UDP-N-acetylmuramoyl-tripeptide--D-alanyl-D-alanine ligase [Vespertiliibacter pulmonis]QLB20426.1 UDP-N-acetylmuramoyl-tripeptide--D-alanyl-D-alanine ligase [Vespertiliibacter pulmonis]RPE86415.1 UDP-N-acetylmuramoyl-tripeptide--D-alanyl-D-alanine ligase [Vespertiliibacter pulmonis]